MNSENKEQTPKKTAQFVCDYRDEQPTEFLPQMQLHSEKKQKRSPHQSLLTIQYLPYM